MKKTILILIILFVNLIGHSQTFVNGYFTYQITSSSPNTVQINDYDTTGGTVVNIPASVTNNSVTFSVTRIKAAAFENDQLTNVTIPNTITDIGAAAFRNNQLANITIPNSVTIIAGSAFENNQLSNITIPNNLTTIANAVFKDNQLSSIIIPANVNTIDEFAFSNNLISSVSIPDHITVLPDGVFNSNQLTDINFISNITSIGGITFRNNLLTSIVLHSNINSIGGSAFIGNSLISVTSESTTPPTIVTGTGDTFGIIERGNIDLHIPTGTTAAYVTDAGALWTGFNTVTEDVLSVSNFELVNHIKVITTIDEISIMYPDNAKFEEYTMYDISGSKAASGTENTIVTNSLAKGIYILKLNFLNRTYTKKVVIN